MAVVGMENFSWIQLNVHAWDYDKISSTLIKRF